MSWSIHLQKYYPGSVITEPEDDDSYIDCGSMTWNISPMYVEALGMGGNGIRELNRFQGRNAAVHLLRAYRQMVSFPDKYKAMNPKNGWGNYEDARNFLKELFDKCYAHPDYWLIIQ